MAMLFELDDDGDKIRLSEASDIQNIWAGGATVTFWMNLLTYGQGNTGNILEKADASTLAWRIYASSDTAVFLTHEHSTTQGVWNSGFGSIGLGVWHHVAISWNKDDTPTVPSFYIDGAIFSTTTDVTPSGTADSDTGLTFTIGSRISRSFSLDGMLEDVRMYGRILSAATILDIYSSRQRDNNHLVDLIRRLPMSPVRTGGLGINTPYLGRENRVQVADTITLTVPTNTDGDALVMVVACAGLTGTAPNITTPSGWTLEVGEDCPSTTNTPTISIFSRSASSEPADYDVTSDVGSQGWTGGIINMGEMSVTSIDTLSDSATNNSPTSPSATPGENSVGIWAYCMDDGWSLPATRDECFPPNARGLWWNAGTNLTMAVAVGPLGSGASGTKEWTPLGSNQWAALTVTFGGGEGLDGLPIKDLSNAADPAETIYKTVGVEGLR